MKEFPQITIARMYAASNLLELANEILEWKKTGQLPELSYLKEMAKSLSDVTAHPLMLAESIVTEVALMRIIKQ